MTVSGLKEKQEEKPLPLEDVITLHKSKNLEDAEQGYCRIIADDPHNHAALNRLGILYVQTGRAEEGVKLIERATNLKPDEIEYQSALAGAYMHLQRFQQAIDILHSALLKNPNHAAMNANLGTLLSIIGDAKNAETHFKKAIELDPEKPEPYKNLARLYYDQAQYGQSIELNKKATELDPTYAGAWFALGDAYKIKRKFREAEDAYRQSVKYNPNLSHGWINVGTMSLLHDKVEEAGEAYEKALALTPDDIGLYMHYFYYLEATSKREKISDLIEIANKYAPNSPITVYMQAQQLRRDGKLEEAYKMLLPHKNVSNTLGYKINYELGTICDKLKKEDEAFGFFKTANNLYLEEDSVKAIDNNAIFLQLSAIQNRLSPAWLEKWTPPVPNKKHPNPVFLGGFPRSGTTLLDQILISHPDIFVSSERIIMPNALVDAEVNQSDYPGFLEYMPSEQIERVRDEYFKAHKSHKDWEDKPVFIDKVPLNINILDLDYRLFPESKIIVALRHPCDCVLSCFMYEFTPSITMIQTASLERCALLYRKTMDLLEQYEEVLPLPIHKVRYEDLITDMEGEARKIIDFLGLSWDDAVLDYRNTAKNRDYINTPSYSQVTQKLYTSARYRWLRYRKHLEPVIPILQPWIEKYGYSLDEPDSSEN